MDVRSRRGRERETSPDRVKAYMHPRVVKPIKKVQVVYYLSRNGHLEHPHYMEVTHLANQPLRLRDVTERLTVLRGKGMPSLYSWSCKRSYKSGYVWNDLAENDIIYPSEGAEYVLKGSELVEGCSERFQQQVHITNRQQIQEPNFHPKRKQLAPSPQREPEDQEYEEYEEEEEEEEEYEDGEKISYTSSTTPHSRCSRGVSTDELEDHETQTQPQPQKNPTEQYSTLNDSSSAASTVSDKANQSKRFQDGTDPVANQSKRFQDGTDPVPNQSKRFDRGEPVAKTNSKRFDRGEPVAKTNSKRFEDGDPVGNESAQTRNSVLLQLIACGSSAVGKAKNGSGAVKKCDSLHKGVLCKSAVKVAEEDYLIRYMSENPRFGNLQSEEKEYFSGSIVESMSSHEDRPVGTDQPVLKKSNSYNEERSKKVGLVEAVEEEKSEKETVKGKCIPRKKSSASSKPPKK
uniref:SOSEKI DIX-like domain-containing protein n=1 Tax=Fagus sylvatica TaxID=28930 RepID=A0A2N9HLG3_FAGSY